CASFARLFRPCVSSGSGCARALPSFPTRRSSDLDVDLFRPDRADAESQVRESLAIAPGRPILVSVGRVQPLKDQELAIRTLAARSEEHTSELQSRENLVCRLLLEKKNKSKRGVRL